MLLIASVKDAKGRRGRKTDFFQKNIQSSLISTTFRAQALRPYTSQRLSF